VFDITLHPILRLSNISIGIQEIQIKADSNVVYDFVLVCQEFKLHMKNLIQSGDKYNRNM
jgi:hypothetical protein